MRKKPKAKRRRGRLANRRGPGSTINQVVLDILRTLNEKHYGQHLSGISVTLTKITDGKPPVSDALPNQHTLKCSRCEQTYVLAYADREWNNLKDWLKLAATAIRQDHGLRHEAPTIPLEWRGIRRR